jgi:nitroreductase
MDFIHVVRARKSVRSYEEREVPTDIIEQIIEMGALAPTGGNLQAREFIVVREKETKSAIARTTYRGDSFDITKNQDWIADAPVIVVIVANRPVAALRYGYQASDSLVYQDIGACVENMLLSAVNFGLGACYITGFMEHLLSGVLELPVEYEAVACLTLGYPKGEPVPKTKRSSKELIHFDSF